MKNVQQKKPITEEKSDANNERFRKFAGKTSAIMGSPWSFIGAVMLIISWALLGPIFRFSDTWQLVHQYRNHNHNVFDGFLNPKHAKP